MLNPRLRRAVEASLPRFLVRALDPFEAAMSQAVEEFSRSLPGGSRVLDAGAGESRHAAAFSVHRYLALDLAVGDRNWNYSHRDLLGDLECLPLADNSFDAAINVVTLEHVRAPQSAIRELARVLRPGGRLLIV